MKKTTTSLVRTPLWELKIRKRRRKKWSIATRKKSDHKQTIRAVTSQSSATLIRPMEEARGTRSTNVAAVVEAATSSRAKESVKSSTQATRKKRKVRKAKTESVSLSTRFAGKEEIEVVAAVVDAIDRIQADKVKPTKSKKALMVLKVSR